MKDDSDPLNSWRFEEIIQHAPCAKDDIYGGLFFYLRNLFLKFCHRMRNSNVEIQLFRADALALPNLLRARGPAKYFFDRIEVRQIMHLY